MDWPLLGYASIARGGAIIVLNGFPGAGKYTILRSLRDKLRFQRTHLIDHHHLMDPVAAVYPTRCSEQKDLRQEIRRAVFTSIRKVAVKGHLVLMTASLVHDDEDQMILSDYFNIVRGTQIPLIWLNGHCDLDVLARRLASPERVQWARMKLTDEAKLGRIVEHCRLLEPASTIEYHHDEDVVPLHFRALDVSGDVKESVDGIRDILQELEIEKDKGWKLPPAPGGFGMRWEEP